MKNVIITGCSSGFGWLMAKQLAKEGHTVYATMRNLKTANLKAAEELRAWAIENGVNLFITELDICSEDSIKSAVHEIALSCDGKIDVLINNAGFGTIGLMEEYSDEQVKHIFEAFVFGPNTLIKAVLPYMHHNHSGLLILISSRMSAFQLPFSGIYSAAKAAIHAIVKTYKYELKHQGIDSVVVQAGSFNTDIGRKKMLVNNEAVTERYGDWYVKAQTKIVNMFTTYTQPLDTRLVTDVISTIINTPFGERAMVYPVGLGALENPINEINDRSEDISDIVIQKIGI